MPKAALRSRYSGLGAIIGLRLLLASR